MPLWIYGVMLALGWNEMWAVIRSPVYFVFLVLAAFAVYVLYTLNLWGPVIRVSNAMFDQTVTVGKERLREVLLRDDGREEGIEMAPLRRRESRKAAESDDE